MLELENSRQLREAKIKELEDSVALELKAIKAKQELAEKTKHITKEIITLLNSNPEIRDQLSDFIHQAKTTKAFEVFENGIENKVVRISGRDKITTLDGSKKIFSTIDNKEYNTTEELFEENFENKIKEELADNSNVDVIIANSNKIKNTEQLPELKKIDIKTNQAFNRSDKKLKERQERRKVLDMLKLNIDNLIDNSDNVKDYTDSMMIEHYINNLSIDEDKKKLILTMIRKS